MMYGGGASIFVAAIMYHFGSVSSQVGQLLVIERETAVVRSTTERISFIRLPRLETAVLAVAKAETERLEAPTYIKTLALDIKKSSSSKVALSLFIYTHTRWTNLHGLTFY